MKYQPLLSVTVVSLVVGTGTWMLPAQAQQSPGGGAANPQVQVPQVARSGNQLTSGATPAVPTAAAVPMAPQWIPLAADHQQYLDQLLGYWEHKSSLTKRYRCTFKRWEYDATFGPKDVAKTYSEGVIKYAAPDKGLFRVDKVLEYQAPKNPGDQPTWEPPREATSDFDHWICDGEFVYQMDQQNKKLVQNQLPPEVQGQAIGRGPLPFLFNAKADDIKQRFWLRVVTPRDTKGEYWLEAVPKTREDAANFKMITIIIDEADYLPKAMVLYDPNSTTGAALSRTTFQFNNREVNFSVLAEQLNLFHREFYQPKLPVGWKREVNPVQRAPLPPQDAAVGRASGPEATPVQR
ncbi:MAG: TIGR03009 domain-containing protein [Planctomycetaceae bacterium]|nr:TIGR03009 domain-containing protein [Planctomycetaceae bacterium]